MEVERVKITELAADPANVRKHNEKNMAAIKASLRRFGQQKPVVVDSAGVVRAGNGTLAAAISLGWSHIDIVRTELQGAEATAYAIADNRTAELAEWDADALAQTMAALEIEDEELARDAGFSAEDVAAMALSEKLIHEDEAPEPPATPITKLGDVWLLGKHRVMCGDNGKPEARKRLMLGAVPDFVYTDPPYGIDLDTSYQVTAKVKGKTYAPVHGDAEYFSPKMIIEEFAPSRDLFIWGADNFCQQLPLGGSWIVWDKKKEDLDESLSSGFELCWSRTPHRRRVVRILWSGFTAKERGEARTHPTQKPIALAVWFMEKHGKPTDLVADLYLGSGTTLIACEQLGRTCYGMEISPQYCDVIVQRWEKLTGKKAVLESRT